MKDDAILKRLFARLKRMGLPVLVLGAAALVFVYLVNTKPQSKEIEVREKAWPVAAMTVEKRAWQPTVELYGSVDALSYTVLTAALEADVAEVNVIEGSQVTAGDELIRLDERDARLDVAQREADVKLAEAALENEASRHQADIQVLPQERRLLSLAKAEVGRLENLQTKKLSSQSALDTARQVVSRQLVSIARIEQNIRGYQSKKQELQARLDKAQAALSKAELQLQRTHIKAPFDAWITKVLVAPGHRVNKGSRLLELYDRSSLVVRALVPERYLMLIAQAMEAGLSLGFQAEMDEVQLQGRLLTLGGELPVGKGGVDALFKLDNAPPGLVKGTVLKLRLLLPEQDDAVAAPYESIYGADKVYLIDDENRLHSLRVETVGQARVGNETRVLVRSRELTNGSRLLVTQLPNAIEGLLVDVASHD